MPVGRALSGAWEEGYLKVKFAIYDLLMLAVGIIAALIALVLIRYSFEGSPASASQSIGTRRTIEISARGEFSTFGLVSALPSHRRPGGFVVRLKNDSRRISGARVVLNADGNFYTSEPLTIVPDGNREIRVLGPVDDPSSQFSSDFGDNPKYLIERLPFGSVGLMWAENGAVSLVRRKLAIEGWKDGRLKVEDVDQYDWFSSLSDTPRGYRQTLGNLRPRLADRAKDLFKGASLRIESAGGDFYSKFGALLVTLIALYYLLGKPSSIRYLADSQKRELAAYLSRFPNQRIGIVLPEDPKTIPDALALAKDIEQALDEAGWKHQRAHYDTSPVEGLAISGETELPSKRPLWWGLEAVGFYVDYANCCIPTMPNHPPLVLVIGRPTERTPPPIPSLSNRP